MTKPTPAIERFWPKVDKTDACWLWMGAVMPNGYGRFLGPDRRAVLAHRFAYEQLVGPIPEGLHLDHLCRVRNCVRPDHLEPVTCAENHRRGIGNQTAAAFQRAKTHCPHGHPYDEANTRYRRKSSGSLERVCRACDREYQAARRAAYGV